MKRVTQLHHLVYASEGHKQEDVTARIYKGEHWVITQLQRRKYISKGFVQSLKYWLVLNEDKAVDLEEQ